MITKLNSKIPTFPRTDQSGGNSVSVPNNTITNVASTVMNKGKYVVQAEVVFPENSTGFRRINLANTDTGTSIDRYSVLQVPAATGGETVLTMTCLVQLSTQTTVYLNVRQTSGSTLTVTNSGIRRFRLDPVDA